MKQFYFVMFLILPFLFSGSAFAEDPTIDSAYTLVSKQKVNRVLYDFTYKVNITNGDAAIQNVSATVSSSSENTVIMDNSVNFNDLAIEETSASIDTFTLRQDRRHPFDPDVLSWDIAFEADEPVPNINLATSPNEQTFILGEFQNIATSVNFTPPVSGSPFTIAIEQTVTPNSGLSLSPNVNGITFDSSVDFTTTLNQEISPSLVGEYEIVTTATIVETGEEAKSTVKITIVSGEQSSLIINTPGTENGALSPNEITDVVFVVQVQGIGLDNILNVRIDGINNSDSMLLNDSGQNGDVIADDGSYSGTFSINTNGFLPQQCLSYEAVATTNVEPFTSQPYELCVTGFPIGFQPSDTSENNLIPDPETGTPVVADEIMIGFKENASENSIISVVSSVNGQVIGSLVELGIYQVKLDTPVTSPDELAAIIATLTAFPEVTFAEANSIDTESTVIPSDPKFSLQDGLTTIRAGESWYIARGNVTVAVIDGGADFTHPDLTGKLVKGKDVVDGGNDPSEVGTGHGTHVAGIISANTNNNIGIAGVSWNSKILVVRASDSTGSTTSSRIASGIMYAAGKARIINVSLGGTGGRFLKCAATAYAKSKGSLVVAAAGNNSNSTKFYPAACSDVIAVGNTTSSDGRESNSNFGSWVDLAAPGTDILSTVPTGGCNHCDVSGYKSLTGTSMASPMVAGAVAVLLAREPLLTNSQIEERFKKTAKKLPASLKLGAGRIDLFEAVFNGSFEEGNLALWQKSGTVASFEKLGPLIPQDGKRMGYISTGPSAAQTAGNLSQSFTVQEGVSTLPITFTYAFISEEFPEFVGTNFNDSLKISLKAPNETITELATESINSSAYTAISGLDFPGGDTTVGWTGWKTVTKDIPITAGAGEYQIILKDAGDAAFDTILLIDHIQFKK